MPSRYHPFIVALVEWSQAETRTDDETSHKVDLAEIVSEALRCAYRVTQCTTNNPVELQWRLAIEPLVCYTEQLCTGNLKYTSV